MKLNINSQNMSETLPSFLCFKTKEELIENYEKGLLNPLTKYELTLSTSDFEYLRNNYSSSFTPYHITFIVVDVDQLEQ